MDIKNAIILNGKIYEPIITDDNRYQDDCSCCDLRRECEHNPDIYCYLTTFKTVYKESKIHRHFELKSK